MTTPNDPLFYLIMFFIVVVCIVLITLWGEPLDEYE